MNASTNCQFLVYADNFMNWVRFEDVGACHVLVDICVQIWLQSKNMSAK